jgi:hypothetical protein
MIAVLFTGCGKNTEDTTTTTNTDDLPSTINLIGITESSTTFDSIEMVEAALNKLTKTRYKTKVELTLVTADEYIAEVEKRIAEADSAAIKIKAITKYNALAQKEANNAQKLQSESSGKKNNKWTSQVTTVIASTMATGEVYTAEMTTVYEDGKIETVYPDAQSPIDIIMIDGKEMYDYLNEKGYLLSVEKKLDEKFTKFRQYIYPTYFSQLKAMTGDINAIPNNNLLAEYTYLVIDKEIADAYHNGNGFNIDNVDNYDDLEEFLAYVKEDYAGVAPLATKPEALGIFQYMDGEVAIGTYFDPIYGYSATEGTSFTVQNLLSIPQYQAHVALMADYTAKGYIDENAKKYAVNVVKGDASVATEYEAMGYEVKVLQNPFVQPETIFDGMLAVSSYTSSEDRSLEIIEMLTTDPDAKNILQYGILDDGDNTEYANYKLVELEDGNFVVKRLNNNYMMDNGLTGNVYMGYPEEGQPFDAWDYYKQTNLDSAVSPFMLLYVEESELDNILSSVLKRAALTEALAELGISYDEYIKETSNGTSKGVEYIKSLRAANLRYLIAELAKTDAPSTLLDFVTTSSASNVVKEFIKFAQSKEGQEFLADAGYTKTDENAPAYQKVESLQGELKIISNLGSNVTYINMALDGLTNAFKALYPEVTITLPVVQGVDGYNTAMTEIKDANTLGITDKNYPDTFEGTNVAINYTGTIANTATTNPFSQSWFENRIIERVKEEKYAEIISASDLSQLIENKVAVLAGAPNQKGKDDKGKVVELADTERLTLAAAKNNSKDYFTNIKYLRVMADETFFKDLSEADRAKYDAMTDIEFEQAVFNYVKANYEVENNLTAEEYQKRVQDYMVSVLEFTSEEDSSVKYLVSWDDFVAAEEGSLGYSNAASAIVAQYKSKLGYSDALLDMMTLDKVMELVYDAMLDEYLAEQGMSKADFEEMVQNKYLESVGTNAADFKKYSKTSDEYKNYVSKLRKKFKAVLIETYSATAYKNGDKGISNEKVVSALYDYYLEQEAGIYAKMAEMAGMSVEDFRASEKNYSNYSRYVKTLTTKFVYTLRAAGYTQSQIDKFTPAEGKTIVLNILAESGFYTNEMVKYIGLTLNEYMIAKSNAEEYRAYQKALAEALAADIAAYGYDKNALVNGDGTELEAVAREIVADKYFGEKVGITDVLKEMSGSYVKDYTDVEEMKANADKLTKDGFFMAVVNELQTMWTDIKAASEG